MPRAFVVVLDGCGVGALPDAAEYGDVGANTLGHVAAAVDGLELPTLQRLGLGSAVPLLGVTSAEAPALHGRLHPLGPGKDTVAGHRELMGIVARAPSPTYEGGFPSEVVDALREATGRGILCNRPYSGLAAIEDYGARHLRTGDLIVYTGAESVLQIAAHIDAVAPRKLYAACAAARDVMRGRHTVGRVIARPFTGAPGAFLRTEGRRDFVLPPIARSYLDEVCEAGFPVHAVGKVADVFAGVGVDVAHPGPTNARAIAETERLVDQLDHGLAFVNLIETDEVYGHRKDPEGFHAALRTIDAAVERWLARLDPARDLLVLTADHGVDPLATGFNHTREHVPLLACFRGHGGRHHEGPLADVGASVLRWLAGRDAPALPGRPFVDAVAGRAGQATRGSTASATRVGASS